MNACTHACTHTLAHACMHHTPTRTHQSHIRAMRAMRLKKRFLKRERFQGRFKRVDRGRMADRNRELVPDNWSLVREIITKKAQRCMFPLCQLKKFRVNKTILTLFYQAVIESVLTFSITVCLEVLVITTRTCSKGLLRQPQRSLAANFPRLSQSTQPALITKLQP